MLRVRNAIGLARVLGSARREQGQGLAEYALILAFIAAVCIAALSALGIGISTSPGFTTLVDAIT